MVVVITVGLGIMIIGVGFGVGVEDCSAEQARRGSRTIGINTTFFILSILCKVNTCLENCRNQLFRDLLIFVKRRLIIYSLHGDEDLQNFLTSSKLVPIDIRPSIEQMY